MRLKPGSVVRDIKQINLFAPWTFSNFFPADFTYSAIAVQTFIVSTVNQLMFARFASGALA